MVTRLQAERVLDTYSFEEVLELNELDEIDVLEHLINMRIVRIPEPLPVDFYDE
jgi:hypothetical protein